MHSKKSAVFALALSGVILFGAMTLTAAAPQKKKPTKPNGGSSAALIAQGKKVYAANNCAACHVIGDKGGKTGPALTHIGKEKKADWLTTQIRDPKKNKPTGLMPPFGEDKINAKSLKVLVAYLGSLK